MIARYLLKDSRAASAAEFALVLPLLLIFLLGIVDAGRFMWEYNRAEKATQMGARFAAVTDPAALGLASYSFAVNDAVTQGNPVPTANFASVTCTSTNDCADCDGGNVCGTITLDSTAFNNIVARMAAMYPAIASGNVQVEYQNVGLGYSGDPNGSDVEPLITVRLTGLTFHPISCFVFPCSIAMPSFSAALTGEDLSGSNSN